MDRWHGSYVTRQLVTSARFIGLGQLISYILGWGGKNKTEMLRRGASLAVQSPKNPRVISNDSGRGTETSMELR